MWARTLCPLLSSTRNMALGSGSTTLPSTSMAPSFLAMSSAFPALPLYQTYWARTLLRPRLWAARSRLADKHRRLHARDRPPLAATARSPDVLWAWKPAACAIDQLTHPATDTQTGRGDGKIAGLGRVADWCDHGSAVRPRPGAGEQPQRSCGGAALHHRTGPAGRTVGLSAVLGG